MKKLQAGADVVGAVELDKQNDTESRSGSGSDHYRQLSGEATVLEVSSCASSERCCHEEEEQ